MATTNNRNKSQTKASCNVRPHVIGCCVFTVPSTRWPSGLRGLRGLLPVSTGDGTSWCPPLSGPSCRAGARPSRLHMRKAEGWVVCPRSTPGGCESTTVLPAWPGPAQGTTAGVRAPGRPLPEWKGSHLAVWGCRGRCGASLPASRVFPFPRSPLSGPGVGSWRSAPVPSSASTGGHLLT